MDTRASKESSSVVDGIVGFLSERGKTNLLSSVAAVLDEVVDKTKKADKIIVMSAVPLSKSELKHIRTIVSRFLKRDLPATNSVDRRLVGGFAIRVGDFFLDASIASELTRVKQLILS